MSFLITAEGRKSTNAFLVSYLAELMQGYPRYFSCILTHFSGWEEATITSTPGDCHGLSALNLSCRAQHWMNQEGNERESDSPFPPLQTPSSSPPPWHKHHSTFIRLRSSPFTSKAQRSRPHGPTSIVRDSE